MIQFNALNDVLHVVALSMASNVILGNESSRHFVCIMGHSDAQSEDQREGNIINMDSFDPSDSGVCW